MTVSELIEQLNKIENKELEVIIDGDGVGWECTEVEVRQYSDGTASVQILH
jgi:hypothetical protein